MKSFIDFLDERIGENCTIKVKGFVNAIIEIKNMKYTIINDILEIKDKESCNKINLNLNQVYKIQESDLSLDNDVIISIE